VCVLVATATTAEGFMSDKNRVFCSSETLLILYQITRCHNTGYYIIRGFPFNAGPAQAVRVLGLLISGIFSFKEPKHVAVGSLTRNKLCSTDMFIDLLLPVICSARRYFKIAGTFWTRSSESRPRVNPVESYSRPYDIKYH
jgi:hypothetical protein